MNKFKKAELTQKLLNIKKKGEYIKLPPISMKERKDTLARMKVLRETKMYAMSGQKSHGTTRSTVCREDQARFRRKFKKDGNISLRQFVRSYQEELGYACYEKVFYPLKEKGVINLLWNQGFLDITESHLKFSENQPQKNLIRRRYYIKYDKRFEFIDFLNEYVIAPFRTHNHKKTNRKY